MAASALTRGARARALVQAKAGTAELARRMTSLAERQDPRGAAEIPAPVCALQLAEHIEGIRAAGLFKTERIIASPQGAHVEILDAPNETSTAPGHTKKVLNFCSNNYLGLSNHSAVVAAAQSALESHGFGLSSVRFICGTQDLHAELERRLAQFHATGNAVLFPSCFDANAGLFEALLSDRDAVISDELNHASIIDGIRLCKARRMRFRHVDMDDLEAKLKETQDARVRLIATDGVFSMQGDMAPLRDICFLANKYSALVFVDDCHATGFLGPGGRGTPALFGVQDQVHFLNSTLGKALGGGTGGYTAASSEVGTMLRQKARPYLFSNSLAPPMAAAGIAVLDLVECAEHLRDALMANTRRFRDGMRQAGFDILDGTHPIVPAMLEDARLAHDLAEHLLWRNVYVVGFSYPVVPKGQARIRVQLSAAHSAEDVDKCIAAFRDAGQNLGII